MIYIITITLAIIVVLLMAILIECRKRINYLQRSVDFLEDENCDMQA